MRYGRLAMVAIALSSSAEAQNTVVGVTSDVWQRNGFGMQLGRELLPARRRLSLRLSIEYTRFGQRGPARALTMSDSGFLTYLPIFAATQSRSAGVWLTSSFRPIRWIIDPYLIGGIGLQDSYRHYEWSGPDSAWQSYGWDQGQARTSTRSWFGPALLGGLGLSARLGRATLFAENTVTTELSPYGTETGSLYYRPRPRLGVRF